MAKDRKTVSIDCLLEYANGYLASDYANGDSEESRMRRTGVIDLLESALHAVGRYRGYSYLDEKAITLSKPGVRWLERGHTFDNTDNTRRRYA
jgi:hypothetical protein